MRLLPDLAVRVFISWSGAASHEVARALSEWLHAIDSGFEPFESARAISKGSVWFSELSAHLRGSAFGIIVVTPENMHSPWINYEAGALFNGLTEARVVPFLVGMGGDEVPEGPLAMFQALRPEKAQLLDLARQMNALLPRPRTDHMLVQRFEKAWQDLEVALRSAADTLKSDRGEGPLVDLIAFGRTQRQLDVQARGIADVLVSARVLRVAGGTLKTFCDDSRILSALRAMIDRGDPAKILMLHPEGDAIGMLARMRKDYSPRTTEERLRLEIQMSLDRLLDTLGVDAVQQVVRMSEVLPRFGLCISDRLAVVTLYLHGHGASSPSFGLDTNDSRTRDFCDALVVGFDEAWASSLSHVPDLA